MPDPESAAWARIEALVDELLDLDPEDRPGALARARATDRDVAEQAERLLDAMGDVADDALDSPLFVSSPELIAEATQEAASDRSGTVLGPYRLLQVLGRGGMGVVYLAERADEEFEKQVAIKLMPRGLESEEAIRRFRLERQVLARLEHPSIARLLDGGVTDEGYPYLVMELVEGRPLDAYCEANALGLDQRLRLFLDACGAVQYAHQNLIVHRDLKPNNILVTEHGGVKLLDFGVAKLLDEEAVADSITRFQPRTTAYASPEQLANRPVSTASDVYSLGVVLYRLLTGATPREADGTSEEPGHRSGTTTRPSEAAQRLSETGQRVPWQSRLAGDLDRIVLAALAEAPSERYPTVEALAEDLRRFLGGLPISAQEPTMAYRLRKFVARHRAGVVASVLAALALTATLVAALWQADRARAQAQRAERVSDLLAGLFSDADPWAPTSGEVTVPEILGRGVDRVRSQLADDPGTRSRLLDVLGRAYNGQGHPENGIPLLEEVLAERRERLGDRHPDTVEAMRTLGQALAAADDLERAAPLVEGAFALAEEIYDPAGTEMADHLFALGSLRHEQRDYERQERVFRRLVEHLRRSGETESSRLALSLGELSIALDFQDRDVESLEIQRQALEMAEATLPAPHPFTATLRNNMGLRLWEAGDLEQATVYLRRALESFENRPGLHEEELVAPLSNIGRLLTSAGDFAAAREYVERAAEIAGRVHPPDHFTRIGAEINLASVLFELDELQEAADIYRNAERRFEAMLGPEHQATARARCLLGATLARLGETAVAESALTRALRVQREGAGDPMYPDETLLALGRLRLDQGRLDESEGLLAEALAAREETLPPDHWRLAEIRLELAALAQGRGEAEADLAEASRRTLEETLPSGNFRLERAAPLLRDGS